MERFETCLRPHSVAILAYPESYLVKWCTSPHTHTHTKQQKQAAQKTWHWALVVLHQPAPTPPYAPHRRRREDMRRSRVRTRYALPAILLVPFVLFYLYLQPLGPPTHVPSADSAPAVPQPPPQPPPSPHLPLTPPTPASPRASRLPRKTGREPGAAAPAAKGLRLAGQFSDNMVLQRGAVNCFWGYSARPGQPVDLVFEEEGGGSRVHQNRTVSVALTAEDGAQTDDAGGGTFRLCLPPLQAGPVPVQYTATVSSGKERVRLRNLLLGDVWLCGGQSNMQFPFRKIRPLVRVNATDEYSKYIRMMLLKKDWSPLTHAWHQSLILSVC